MGNQLRQPITSKVVDTAGNKHFRVAVAAMNGYREAMEDSHCIRCTDTYGLFGVFDGHSGTHCSAFCAERLPALIEARGTPLTDEAVVELTLQMDAEFDARKQDSGCTACYCVAIPGAEGVVQLQVANVGDSRIIVGRNGGAEGVPMTEDHKPSLAAEQERILRCGGTVSGDRVDGMLAMSRAMGDTEYKRGPGGPREQKVIALPDVTRLECHPADWVLVACDGVFESNFSNEEVVAFVREAMERTAGDLVQVVCAVCDEALKRGSTDNVTAMLVQFQDGEGYGRPAPLFLPGPYMTGQGSFKAAYRAMAARAGLSLGEALERRYDLLRDQMAQRITALKSEDSPHDKPDEELKRLQEEAAVFKPGPQRREGAARTAWFEEFGGAEDPEGEARNGVQVDAQMLEQFKQVLSAGGGNLGGLTMGEGRPGPKGAEEGSPKSKERRGNKRKEGKAR